MAPSPDRDSAGLDDAPWVVEWLDTLVDQGRASATIDGYRRDVRAIGAEAAGVVGIPADELTVDQLSADVLTRSFRAWARQAPVRRRRTRHDPELRSVAARRRAWAAWNSLFGWLVTTGRCDGNPMAAVPRPGREETLPRDIDVPDALPRLLRAAAEPVDDGRSTRWPARDVALVAVIAFGGLRVAEAVGLDRADLVRGLEPRLRVIGKGRKERVVPTLVPVVERVDAYLDERVERFGPLPRPGSDRVPDRLRALWVHARTGERITVAQVEHLIGRLYVRAGLAGAVPEGSRVHALRHHAAHTWLDNGAQVTEVQALLGHASLDTTQRYVKARGGQLRGAVAANPDLRALDDLD